jgi:hypothetical protein
MQHVQLTSEEIEALRDLLEHHVNSMEVEEHRTDALPFKNKLRHEAQLFRSVLQKLAMVPILT